MGISEMLSLCGGLALFLYGMHMMSSGLEAAAGDRMKQMLEKLTSNTIWRVTVRLSPHLYSHRQLQRLCLWAL